MPSPKHFCQLFCLLIGLGDEEGDNSHSSAAASAGAGGAGQSVVHASAADIIPITIRWTMKRASQMRRRCPSQKLRLSNAPLSFVRMSTNDWQTELRRVYDRGIAAWKEGRKSPGGMFAREDAAFLATIGCTAQEMFDFVDDARRYGEPDFATTLAVTALRRDYFLNVLKGKPAGHLLSMDRLPAKVAEVDGIAWLPRIIEKARWKLRGEMPADLMYGCGGDRAFLDSVKMDLPEFLQLVRDCGDDNRRIIDAVKKARVRN
jgi:hypothetical protein